MYVVSLISQIINLSWEIVVQNADCVFTYICHRHKKICGYIFVEPLSYRALSINNYFWIFLKIGGKNARNSKFEGISDLVCQISDIEEKI